MSIFDKRLAVATLAIVESPDTPPIMRAKLALKLFDLREADTVIEGEATPVIAPPKPEPIEAPQFNPPSPSPQEGTDGRRTRRPISDDERQAMENLLDTMNNREIADRFNRDPSVIWNIRQRRDERIAAEQQSSREALAARFNG